MKCYLFQKDVKKCNGTCGNCIETNTDGTTEELNENIYLDRIPKRNRERVI